MKVALIGASVGQLSICKKAKELGHEIVCFAWPENAICQKYADKFYPISILEVDCIVDICKKEAVQGVITNASDLSAYIAAAVAEKLGCPGNPVKVFEKIKNKEIVRKATSKTPNLCTINHFIYKSGGPKFLPCIVKPIDGVSKKGVSLANTEETFFQAIKYSKQELPNSDILIEEFIKGREISVESISCNGTHYVIQITDKDNTGSPHFVEIGHHQPSSLLRPIQDKIRQVIPEILKSVGFMNGASHIEMKVDGENLYLIEINPRGGGDEISNKLVELSTEYDYLKSMIEVALGTFQPEKVFNRHFAGIYFLCKQAETYSNFFKQEGQPWLVEKNIKNYILVNSKTNYDRNGYLIYKWSKKILPEEQERGSQT